MMVQGQATAPWQRYLNVQVLAPEEVQMSRQGRLRVELTTLPPWKINLDLPIRLEVVDARSNVEVKNRSQPLVTAAVNGQGHFIEAELHGLRAGVSKLSGRLELAVCTESACMPLKIPVTAELQVIDPSPMSEDVHQR